MELTVRSPEHYMKLAFEEANQAFEEEEIPVGAVVVCNDQVIARAYNQTERLNDVTAHAEMLAITSATEHLGGKYLDKCALYVTLEPCVMCAGALYWSRIGRIVFATPDEKRGYSLISDGILHPRTQVEQGPYEKESKELLQAFFKKKR